MFRTRPPSSASGAPCPLAQAFRALHGCAPEKQGAALAFEFPAVAGAIPQGMDRLRDSTALVTGASAGIGRAIAGALGAAGLRVVAVARRGQRLQELRADLEAVGCGEGRYLAVEADVTDEAAVESIPARIREAFGEGSGVDVCVNNAGIGAQGTNLMGGNTADWRHVLDVNVVALCVVTRMAVQDMERRGRWGHVTHVSSMSGHRVASGSSAFYAGTKHMVRALADGLRMEARARGVPLRVGSLSPGFVDTEFFAVWSGDENAAPPLERPLQARDVAAALLFQLGAPEHVDVNDVLMRPLDQKS